MHYLADKQCGEDHQMSTNPLNPSFRKPHNIPQEAAHPLVRQFARDTDKSITDLNQAIAAIKAQVTASTKASSSTTTVTENISSETTAGTVTGGVVNNQTGVTAYTTQQSDNAGFIILDDASAIAVTLSSTITIPYFTWIANYGAGAATLTPDAGTITYPGNIGASSMPLASGFAAYLEFDGSNWWAIRIAITGSNSGAVVQNVLLGTGTLAPQVNLTASPASVLGQSATSIITANVVGPVGGQPFFIQLTCWWNATSGVMTIEVSNCSTTLTWTYTGMSLQVAVWV